MSDTGHVPGEVNNEFPDPVETPEQAAPAPEKEPEAETPKGDEPEANEPKQEETPKPEGEQDEQTPADPVNKPRSIYEAKQAEKARRKEAEAALATEREARTAAEARAAELEALLGAKDTATTPKEKSEAKDAIDEWAEKQGLDGTAVRELTDIIKGALPKPEGSVLTKEEANEWRADRARAKATAEDQAVLTEAPAVRKQLEEFGVKVHDEAEFQAVMAEIVKLSHTKDFHDKPVDYIVYRNRDVLGKMISPKKKSFEAGGQHQDSAGTEPDFSGSGITPAMAQEGISQRGRSAGYEVRGGNQ
jgi:hypothetical protein